MLVYCNLEDMGGVGLGGGVLLLDEELMWLLWEISFNMMLFWLVDMVVLIVCEIKNMFFGFMMWFEDELDFDGLLVLVGIDLLISIEFWNWIC